MFSEIDHDLITDKFFGGQTRAAIQEQIGERIQDKPITWLTTSSDIF